MTTIKDIAKEVGVSVATVSRALNDSGYASSGVKKKVLDAARKLNYVPNEVARSLYNNKSRVIGVLVPDISNPYFPRMIRGIEDAANENNYRILLGNTDQNIDKEKKYLEIFHQNNCAGIITATWTVEKSIQKLKMPVVMIDRVNDKYVSVEADNFKGGRIQADHLTEQGAKHILIIAGPEKYSSFRNRTIGASERLNDLKINCEVKDSISVRTLMDKNDIKFFRGFDGIICPNDMYAYEVLSFLNENNINIPSEIKIIGFDDLEFSKWVSPELTTVRQPIYEMGKEAFALLIQEGEKNKRNILDVELIQRKST